MRKLQKLALRRRVGVVAITHLTENSHKDYASDVQGSVGGVSSCDTLLHLSRSRGSSTAVLQMTSRETGEKTIPLDLTGAGQCRLDPATEEAWMSPERKAIIDALRDLSPRGPKEVAAVTGLPFGSVRVTVSKMAKSGQLRRVLGGYALPEIPACNANTANTTAGQPSPSGGDPTLPVEDLPAGVATVVSLADFLRSRHVLPAGPGN